MRGAFRENRARIADINSQIEDSLSGIRVVKSFSNEETEMDKFEEGNSRFVAFEEKDIPVYGVLQFRDGRIFHADHGGISSDGRVADDERGTFRGGSGDLPSLYQ